MTTKDVREFRDSMIEGVYVKTPIGNAKLLKKYRHNAMTSTGCWTWSQIYFSEHDIVLDHQKKTVKEIAKANVEAWEKDIN